MPVQRALFLAAAASAALALAGCGSDRSDTSTADAPAATSAGPAATTAPDAATTPTTPAATDCPFPGASDVPAGLPGSKFGSATAGACSWLKGDESIAYAFAAGSTLTKTGKYPDLYTVFEKAAKKNPKTNFTTLDIGDTAYETSVTKPVPQASITWVQDGNVLNVKLSGFKKTESARKAAEAAIVPVAKKVSAAQ